MRIDVKELHRLQTSEPSLQIIDVREAGEFATEHAHGALSVPLSRLEQAAHALVKQQPVAVFCRSGDRSEGAVARLSQLGFTDVRLVDGGLNAWKAASLPIVVGTRHVWSLERQVRTGAGIFVLAGTLLGWFAHPAWFAIPAFVGGGLIFSGVTNTCGMALMLARMPWNRSA